MSAVLPQEFFTPAELATILGTPQPKRQRELLKEAGVPFVPSASGYPRVYRDKLLPDQKTAQNDAFDFAAIARRTPKASRK